METDQPPPSSNTSSAGPALAGPTHRGVPDGDDRERLICRDCGFINYENPKIDVGAVCTWEDKFLLCRRAIEPRLGYWTLPAGYMETGETTEAGAKREAWEEARAKLEIDALLAIYNIPRISQVQVMYRARLTTPDVSAGPESQEVGLFTWDEIPWEDIAFPTVKWALDYHQQVVGQSVFAPGTNPPDVGGES